MIQIGIHKDIINEYQEKIIAGLSTRKLIACGIAFPLGALIAWVLSTCWQAPTEIIAVIVICVSIPIWYLGFFRPHDMDPERYLELWIQSRFGQTRLPYVRENNCASVLQLMKERMALEVQPSKKDLKQRKRESEWCVSKPGTKRELSQRRRAWKQRKAAVRA